MGEGEILGRKGEPFAQTTVPVPGRREAMHLFYSLWHLIIASPC